MKEREAQEGMQLLIAWGEELKMKNATLKKQVGRGKSKAEGLNDTIVKLRRDVQTAEGSSAQLGDDEIQAIIEERVKDNLRPRQLLEETEAESEEDDEVENSESSPAKVQRRRMYGLGAARVVQDFIQAGTPLVKIGPLIKRVVLEAVRVKLDGKTSFSGTQCK
ncbi:unnamed protein product, partial [Pylaiella littoralis]